MGFWAKIRTVNGLLNGNVVVENLELSPKLRRVPVSFPFNQFGLEENDWIGASLCIFT